MCTLRSMLPCEEVMNRFKLFGETLAGMYLVWEDGNLFKSNNLRNCQSGLLTR